MHYDYIIVGAGSAGCIIATRLTENPDISVLLIEAGPDYPEIENLPEEVKLGYATEIDISTNKHNWQYTARGTDEAEIMVPRGKVTGGSSAINAQYSCVESPRTMIGGPIGGMIGGRIKTSLRTSTRLKPT